MISRAGLSTLLFISTLLAWAPPATAQSYPSKPIRIVVPFPSGGIADIYSRILGNRLTETWGQPVVVENRAGAGGNIGADLVAKSPPDGYTLGIGTIGTHAVNVTLFSKLPYDPVRDFAPIAMLLEAEGLLVVHPSVPVHSVPELISHARANPGALTFASAGMGTASHLAGELFKSMAKVEMVHVPYKGSAPAVADLLAGHVKVMFDNLASSWPYVTQGQLRALGVTGAERDPLAPGVPAIAETLPGFDASSWAGLMAPAKTPPAIVEKISAAVQHAIKMPDVAEKFKAVGATPVGDSPEHFAKYLKEDIGRWRAVVDKAGVKIE